MRLPGPLWLPRAGAWLLPLSLLACIVPTAETALLERVEKERECTADKLKVTYLGASAYRVEGCGPPQTFICVSYQGWVCTKEGARVAADVPSPPPQVSVPDLPAPDIPPPYIPPPPPPQTF